MARTARATGSGSQAGVDPVSYTHLDVYKRQVLAADIPAVREACGEAALYFDPRNRASLEDAMRGIMDAGGDTTGLVEKARANLARFSWDKSAGALLSTLSEMAAPQP